MPTIDPMERRNHFGYQANDAVCVDGSAAMRGLKQKTEQRVAVK